MLAPVFEWTVGRVRLRVAVGDLFDAPVESIVNSEQSDFVLAFDPESISGQVRRRWGATVQPQLREQTQDQVMPVGTVLTTRGGNSPVIFHAGFHHPDDFLSDSSDEAGTEHVRVIADCVNRILGGMDGEGVRSIAFPLIGCGIFGLSPRLLAREFFNQVQTFGAWGGTSTSGPTNEVWLVLDRTGLIGPVVQAGTQAWAEQLPANPTFDELKLGVPHLDSFEHKVVRTSHPEWSAWMYVRLAELATGYLCAILSAAHQPPRTPEQLVKANMPVTFGAVLHGAIQAAKSDGTSRSAAESRWVAFVRALLRKEENVDRL
jgi:O-acetyl-ADP-ribose deacetylase (regulator of RNase III)